jgi:hypothetical protein
VVDWIALLSAAGVGAIIVKVLDVLWLQRVVSESERQKWLRAERLRAYAALSRDLMARRGWSDWRAVRDAATEAMLLEEDSAVRKRVDAHLDDVRDTSTRMKNQRDEIDDRTQGAAGDERVLAFEQHRQEERNERDRLLSDARAIVDMLRQSLLRR